MHIPWYTKAKKKKLELGITYAPLADALGCGVSQVGHFLNGRRSASVQELRIIAKVLGMKVTELIEDDAYFVTDEFEKKALELLRGVPEKDKQVILKLLSGYSQENNKPD